MENAKYYHGLLETYLDAKRELEESRELKKSADVRFELAEKAFETAKSNVLTDSNLRRVFE